MIEILVRGFNLFEKMCSSNWIISPCFGVKTQNISNHHPVIYFFGTQTNWGERNSQACGCGCGLAKEKSLLPTLFLTYKSGRIKSAGHLVKKTLKSPEVKSVKATEKLPRAPMRSRIVFHQPSFFRGKLAVKLRGCKSTIRSNAEILLNFRIWSEATKKNTNSHHLTEPTARKPQSSFVLMGTS